jgi:hypothetical protein
MEHKNSIKVLRVAIVVATVAIASVASIASKLALSATARKHALPSNRGSRPGKALHLLYLLHTTLKVSVDEEHI